MYGCDYGWSEAQNVDGSLRCSDYVFGSLYEGFGSVSDACENQRKVCMCTPVGPECVKDAGEKDEEIRCCGMPEQITCRPGYRRVDPIPDVCGGDCPDSWCNNPHLRRARTYKCVPLASASSEASREESKALGAYSTVDATETFVFYGVAIVGLISTLAFLQSAYRNYSASYKVINEVTKLEESNRAC